MSPRCPAVSDATRTKRKRALSHPCTPPMPQAPAVVVAAAMGLPPRLPRRLATRETSCPRTPAPTLTEEMSRRQAVTTTTARQTLRQRGAAETITLIMTTAIAVTAVAAAVSPSAGRRLCAWCSRSVGCGVATGAAWRPSARRASARPSWRCCPR